MKHYYRTLLDKDTIVLWSPVEFHLPASKRHQADRSLPTDTIHCNRTFTWVVSIASDVETRELEVVVTPWLTGAGEWAAGKTSNDAYTVEVDIDRILKRRRIP